MEKLEKIYVFWLYEFTDGSTDELYTADYVWFWRSALPQKCTIVCFRENSDEIVAVNVLYVHVKGETLIEEFYERVYITIYPRLLF